MTRHKEIRLPRTVWRDFGLEKWVCDHPIRAPVKERTVAMAWGIQCRVKGVRLVSDKDGSLDNGEEERPGPLEVGLGGRGDGGEVRMRSVPSGNSTR